MRRAGYTLVEVMTAVVVMTIGAAGILAMQGASVHSNQDAGEISTAVNFGTTWLERVKRDARLWTAVGNTSLDQTKYLKAVNTAADTWVLPARDANESAAADYYGFDTTDAAQAYFCVNLRMNVVHAFNPVTGGVTATADANAVRVDARIWWHRNAADTDRSLPCLAGVPDAATIALPRLRKHYLSTIVSWRAPGWP